MPLPLDMVYVTNKHNFVIGGLSEQNSSIPEGLACKKSHVIFRWWIPNVLIYTIQIHTLLMTHDDTQ